jgi:hypothetical protein
VAVAYAEDLGPGTRWAHRHPDPVHPAQRR